MVNDVRASLASARLINLWIPLQKFS